MTQAPVDVLHEKHKQYLFEHSPADRIIEDHGIYRDRGEPTSEFVISAGGDVSVYQVVGRGPNFRLYER